MRNSIYLSIVAIFLFVSLTNSIAEVTPTTVDAQAAGASAARDFNINNSLTRVQPGTELDVNSSMDAGNSVTNFSATFNGKFNCTSLRVAYFSGIQLRPSSCVLNLAGDQVLSVTFEWCDRPMKGASCTATTWNGPLTVDNNVSLTFSDYTLTLNCPAQGLTCPSTILLTTSMSHDTNNLEAEAATNSADLGTDSRLGNLQDTAMSPEYSVRLSSLRGPVNDCYGQQMTDLQTTGVISDCSGTTSVAFDVPAQECTSLTTCTNTQDIVNSYTTSCYSNVPTALVSCIVNVPTTDCVNQLSTNGYSCESRLQMDTLVCTSSRVVTDEVCSKTMAVNVQTTCTPGSYRGVRQYIGSLDHLDLRVLCQPYRTDNNILVSVGAFGGNPGLAPDWIQRAVPKAGFNNYLFQTMRPMWGGNVYRYVRAYGSGSCNAATCSFTFTFQRDFGASGWLQIGNALNLSVPNPAYTVGADTWTNGCTTLEALQ